MFPGAGVGHPVGRLLPVTVTNKLGWGGGGDALHVQYSDRDRYSNLAWISIFGEFYTFQFWDCALVDDWCNDVVDKNMWDSPQTRICGTVHRQPCKLSLPQTELLQLLISCCFSEEHPHFHVGATGKWAVTWLHEWLYLQFYKYKQLCNCSYFLPTYVTAYVIT